MANLSELFSKLEDSLTNAKSDLAELEKGRKVAISRLRKEAQISKKIWQDIRIVTMEILKSMPTKKRQPKTETPVTE